YMLLALVLLAAGAVTLVSIVLYLLIRRRVPRSWCALLMVIGLAGLVLTVPVSSLRAAVLAVPVPNRQFASGTRDGLLGVTGIIYELGVPDGALILVGLALLGRSLVSAKPRPLPRDDWA